MKKILFIAVAILFSTAMYPNRNLRTNNSKTYVSLSGSYTYSFNENGHAFGGNISVLHTPCKWLHCGTQFGMASNGCFNANVFVGPKIGRKFGFAPSAVVGLRQVRETNKYQNTLNGDGFTYWRPAPNFSYGVNVRLWYDFGHVALFGNVGWEQVCGYGRGEMLKDPWVSVEKTSPKDMITAEIGVSAVLSDNTLKSGNNCLEVGVSGEYTSMGGKVSLDVIKFDMLNFSIGHSYGGFGSFYFETGNAEVGAKWNLDWYPLGSDSHYHASIGVEAAMGMYSRQWSGVALENPERFNTSWGVYSFGGRGALVLSPVEFQFGIVKISAYGSVGVAAQLPVKGLGKFGYDTSTGIAQLYWGGGARVALAL